MPVVTHEYTNKVFAVTTFSQGHIGPISAEIYTCGYTNGFYGRSRGNLNKFQRTKSEENNSKMPLYFQKKLLTGKIINNNNNDNNGKRDSIKNLSINDT